MFGELQKAYRQLKDSAAQAEALAAATERHRLVRELHNSLTQTLFSMNLAVQSAQLAMAGSSRHRLKGISRACRPWRAAQPAKCRRSPGRSHQHSPAQGGLAVALLTAGRAAAGAGRTAGDALKSPASATCPKRCRPPCTGSPRKRSTTSPATRASGRQWSGCAWKTRPPAWKWKMQAAGLTWRAKSDPADSAWRGWPNGLPRSAGSWRSKSHPGQGTRIRVEEKKS